MKSKHYVPLASLTAVAVGLVVLAGCSSGGNYKQGASAGAGLNEAANKITAGTSKIDGVLTNLNALLTSTQGDLVPKFNQFNDSVSDLESSAKHVSDAVKKMRDKGDAYFKAWDEQVAMIKNEDIKTRSATRRKEMENKFAEIKRSYIEASDSFKPLMSDLKDIQTALRTDLTPGGLTSVKGPADKATKESVPLKKALQDLAGHFRDVGAAMSAATAAPSTNAPTSAPKP